MSRHSGERAVLDELALLMLPALAATGTLAGSREEIGDRLHHRTHRNSTAVLGRMVMIAE
jgi:hypothetical protein